MGTQNNRKVYYGPRTKFGYLSRPSIYFSLIFIFNYSCGVVQLCHCDLCRFLRKVTFCMYFQKIIDQGLVPSHLGLKLSHFLKRPRYQDYLLSSLLTLVDDVLFYQLTVVVVWLSLWQAAGEYFIRVSFGTALIASIVIVYTTIIALVTSSRRYFISNFDIYDHNLSWKI